MPAFSCASDFKYFSLLITFPFVCFLWAFYLSGSLAFKPSVFRFFFSLIFEFCASKCQLFVKVLLTFFWGLVWMKSASFKQIGFKVPWMIVEAHI